jgi:hypothetical protein
MILIEDETTVLVDPQSDDTAAIDNGASGT